MRSICSAIGWPRGAGVPRGIPATSCLNDVHNCSYLVGIWKGASSASPIVSNMATRFFGDDDTPGPPGDRTTPPAPLEAPAASSPAEGERRLALLIGNGAYAGGRLRNPRNDADLLAKVLRVLGFEVEVVHDAGKAALEHAIVAFGARLADAGSDSLALFYFAGHGLQHQGQNYLVPVDARIPDVRFLRSGAVRLDFLLEELSQATRRANVIVLDACRNNPIRAAATGAETLQGLAAVESLPDATAIVFSTAAGTEAADGDGDNSPYAAALATSLMRPRARLQDVVFAAAKAVADSTGGRQRPALFVQGALPEVEIAKPEKAPAAPTRMKGPWGGAVTEPGDDMPPLGAGWRLPDPELTIERAFPAHSLRYGLSARDWEQGHPGDLVNEVLSTGRWAEVERGWASREPYAAALVALRNVFAMRPDWGTPDHGVAASAAKIGADAGIRQAFVVLGWLHQVGGGGFPRDPTIDRNILSALAGRGYRYAQLQYGIRLALGVDGRPEPAAAIGWLEQAAEKGAHAALYEIGKLYTDTVRVPHRVDFEKAQHYLERAAATGHVPATSLLAILHLDGKLPHPNRSEAMRLLDLAADAGDAAALYRRGMLLEHGDGAVQSYDAARRDYEVAAGAGSIDAMLALAEHAIFGAGSRAPDPAAAVRWCTAAVDKGSTVAMCHLARLYETGFGVAANSARARELFGNAANAGLPMAHVGLARLAVRLAGASADAAALRRQLEPVIADERGPARSFAMQLLHQFDCRTKLAAAPTLTRLEDISEGPQQAPVTIVVWQSLASRECAELHAGLLPVLRERFVGLGHARIVYREALLGDGTDAAVLVRAAGRSQQLAIMTRLLATQAEWCGSTKEQAFFLLHGAGANGTTPCSHAFSRILVTTRNVSGRKVRTRR